MRRSLRTLLCVLSFVYSRGRALRPVYIRCEFHAIVSQIPFELCATPVATADARQIFANVDPLTCTTNP
jgi:hypothetical protein